MRGGRSGCHRCRRLRGRRAQRTGGNNYDVPDPRCPESDLSPPLAAGGIGNGQAMLAALALGADGVQIGTRFALTKESSAHENFKKLCLNLKEGDTKLLLKKLSPTRLVKGRFRYGSGRSGSRGRPWKNYVSFWAGQAQRKECGGRPKGGGRWRGGTVVCYFWGWNERGEGRKKMIRDFKLSLENVKHSCVRG